MNLKKWMSAVTLCAVTLTCTAVPALADNDTAGVGVSSPNLGAAADAMNAAMDQLNGGGGTNSGNSGSGQPNDPVVGIDYVSLTNPAETIDGQTYLPLRATLAAMKDQSLNVEWKAEGQEKLRLYNDNANFEVYLVNGESGLQLQQGGTTYTLKNVDGTTYVQLDFIEAITPSVNLGLSGDKILVLSAVDGTNVWTGNFWGNMNAYQSPVVEEPEEPEQPPVDPPEVTYPDVKPPVDPPSDNDGGNSGNGGGSNSGGNGGGGIVVGDNLLWPAGSTYITSPYGYRIDPVGGIVGDFHLGVDIAGSQGDPVYAAQGGTVIRASWFSTYGNCIDIQHPSGLVTRYAHLSAYHVSVGDTVSQGQVIADIGATGNVTGPHLHFETIVNGSTVDPMSFF